MERTKGARRGGDIGGAASAETYVTEPLGGHPVLVQGWVETVDVEGSGASVAAHQVTISATR